MTITGVAGSGHSSMHDRPAMQGQLAAACMVVRATSTGNTLTSYHGNVSCMHPVAGVYA